MAESMNTTTSLGNWNFYDQHVQRNLNGGDFVNSQSCIICATAPRAEMLAGVDAGSTVTSAAEGNNGAAYAIPIGIVSDFSLQQQKQMAKIYEIGSSRSYTVSSGRTDIGLQLNRVVYRGPSLLAVLMAYYPKEKFTQQALEILDRDKEIGLDMKVDIGLKKGHPVVDNLPEIVYTPGYNNFWLNLASNLFSQPMGLLLLMKDQNKRDTASVYLEDCYIQTHSFSVSSASAILAESVSITADRVLPQKVNLVTT